MSDPLLPGIPYPKPEPASLFATVLAMKNVVETMGGLRGDGKSRSARFEELQELGIKASTKDVLEGVNKGKNVTPDALAALWEKTILAVADPLVLGEGGYFVITGTATITDIDFATPKDGRSAWIRFTAGTVLVNGANLVLPGGANITTGTGDHALFVQNSGDQGYIASYIRGDGSPLTGLATTTEVLTGTNAAKTVTPDALAALWEYGVSVTAASTTTLGEGGAFYINGTADINAIVFATPKNGRSAWIISNGTFKLKYSASLILPGYTDITTRVGDAFKIITDGATGCRVVDYTWTDVIPPTWASTTEVLTGTYSAKIVTPDALAALWEFGADVTAAATTNLGEGGYFRISGAATITNIVFATPKDGRPALLRFASSGAILTNGASLYLPAGQSTITVAAGDMAYGVQHPGPVFIITQYIRADGSVLGALPLPGGQIVFPATQNPSAGVNVLDDYEEGTFTPALTFGGAAVGMTFSSQVGAYTKIGRLVFFTLQIILSAKGSSAGAVLITGLPFTVSGGPNPCAFRATSVTSGVGDTALFAYPANATTNVIPAKIVTGTSTQLVDTDLTATSNLSASGCYHV